MPPPRHLQAGRRAVAPSRRRRSGRQRAVLVALGTVFVLLVGALTVVGYALVQLNSIDRYDDLDVDAAPAGEPENYLVVGSDSRQNGTAEEAASVEGRRSDTIMVMRIDPQEESAAVLSLPRDLVVPIAPSGEEARINSAYSSGTPDEGRQALIDTIRNNFGIELNHYVEIDFQGFARLVDAVGGVPLWFDAAVRDRQSGLYQTNLGCVTLGGDQALPFVRSRHLQYMTPEGEWQSDPTGDLGRITRQQVFMRNALSKVTAEASNPVRARELVEIAVDAVGLDGEMGIGDILDLADRFRDFDTSQLLTYSLPIVENGDGATVSVDDANAGPVLDLFRGDDDEVGGTVPEVSPASVHVNVLNGTGVSGQASQVAEALGAIGFVVDGTGDSPESLARTTIRHRSGDEAYAQRVARHVSGGAVLEVDDTLAAGQVTIVTGDDFTSIHEEPDPPGTVETDAPVESAGGLADGESAAAAFPASPSQETPDDTATDEAPPVATTIGAAIGVPPPGAECG